MKHLKKILMTGAALCLVATMCITAFAATVRTPKADGQNKNHWCWATAAKIVGVHNGGSWISSTAVKLTDTKGVHSYGGTPFYGQDANGNYTANGVQHTLVKHVKNSDADNGGDDADKESALDYAANYSVTCGTFSAYPSALSSTQVQSVKNDLNNGNYVIGNMYASGFGGHSVAIISYNADTDKYRIKDPWDLTDYYYSNDDIFVNTEYPIGGTKARIEWINYCR